MSKCRAKKMHDPQLTWLNKDYVEIVNIFISVNDLVNNLKY